ncbi:GH3 auxin-responsive promoter family protein [soil metagenome]
MSSTNMAELISPVARLAASGPLRSVFNAGFRGFARLRTGDLDGADPVAEQARQLLKLVSRARKTRFGRDHGFSRLLRSWKGDETRFIAEYQRAVPLRDYEGIWTEYLRDAYPVLDDVTWPGRIPYFALTSGTTQGATKYIPVSRQMLASNRWAAKTMTCFHLAERPDSQLFRGKIFFLGGSTALEEPAPGVLQGDLSAIAALEISEFLRPYTFPPLELALESDWDRKLSQMAERSLQEPISLVGGVPSWLLMLFQRLLELSGKETMAEVWPSLEVVVHGGVKFDPYRESFARVLGSDQIRLQETYPCSEGFIAFGDPSTDLLRLICDHGLFYEFVPADEVGSDHPTRHWLGNVEPGVNYAIVLSTCAGMWSHVVGDTVRFESLRPPLISFTGRTKYTLSAFGEHLISEEVEAAVAEAAKRTGASVREWHVGPVFSGSLGHHRFVFDFLAPPHDLNAFRTALDADLSRRNADYQAHRVEGVGLPLPELVVARPGGFDNWMRSKGKLGGQHKVPRMDSSGELTGQIVGFLEGSGEIERRLPAGEAMGIMA